MDADLPPVGSLWLHEDGERRFVLWVGDMSIAYFAILSNGCAEQRERQISFADWLAWQSKARRIDKEDA